jgi:hypothetical protein
MRSGSCCQHNSNAPIVRRSPASAVGQVAAWVLPSAALIFVPKCPTCLAAYAALWTGLGMSFTTATYLRGLWLSVCIGSLLLLVITRVNSRFANNRNFKNTETES